MKRNRAKCAKCGDIIESIRAHDFLWCKCKTIFIDGGNSPTGCWRYGGDFASLIRIDDDGNEIRPKQAPKKRKFDRYTAWGNGQLMVTAAHRYCLGRSTYIVDDCINWLRLIWKDLDRDVRDRIISETQEALDKGQAGMEMDAQNWREFLESVKE